MTAAVLISIGVAGTVAALFMGIPPPTPTLWPIAVGFIVVGLSGLASTLLWFYIQLRRLAALPLDKEASP